jgi:hypothetical protein
MNDGTSLDDIINILTTPVGTGSRSASNIPWRKIVPSTVTSSFRLKQYTVGLELGGNVGTFGIGALVEWGSSSQGSGAVIIQKDNPPPTSGHHWDFALAIKASKFRFTDLITERSLAESIDNALVCCFIRYIQNLKLNS